MHNIFLVWSREKIYVCKGMVSSRSWGSSFCLSFSIPCFLPSTDHTTHTHTVWKFFHGQLNFEWKCKLKISARKQWFAVSPLGHATPVVLQCQLFFSILSSLSLQKSFLLCGSEVMDALWELLVISPRTDIPWLGVWGTEGKVGSHSIVQKKNEHHWFSSMALLETSSLYN